MGIPFLGRIPLSIGSHLFRRRHTACRRNDADAEPFLALATKVKRLVVSAEGLTKPAQRSFRKSGQAGRGAAFMSSSPDIPCGIDPSLDPDDLSGEVMILIRKRTEMCITQFQAVQSFCSFGENAVRIMSCFTQCLSPVGSVIADRRKEHEWAAWIDPCHQQLYPQNNYPDKSEIAPCR